ncbi:MAG: class I SAM-dependent methyltransferase [Candidatus Absconditabacterales bacterium]|nr:class I SAM-dependent methyltransferase [Candidatus Absconditabacterales bacterium]
MLNLCDTTPVINLDEQLKESFRVRDLDQKFLYLEEGAKLFYKEKKADFLYGIFSVNEKTLKELDLQSICDKTKGASNALISLGCGNSQTESMILQNCDSKVNIEYFGIDISKAMLDLSIKNLKNVGKKTNFICSDFTSNEFKSKIIDLTSKKTNRVYVMFGNIFGNFKSSKLINILNNILKSGDKLWIDVRLKKGDTVGDDLRLFNHYRSYLNSKEQVDFFSNIFWKLGTPKENFYLYLTTFHDQVLGSLRFDFSATFTKKTTLNIAGDEFIILPNENMHIVHIYAYDYYKLINFFQEHGFVLKKMSNDDGRGHFIFEKN